MRRSGAALYVTNPRFAGEAESSALSADSDSAPVSLEDEELFVGLFGAAPGGGVEEGVRHRSVYESRESG